MFLKRVVFGMFFLFCYSTAALSEPSSSESIFYHCEKKSGERIISNQPCTDLDAKETKRIDADALAPLNSIQGGTSQVSSGRPQPTVQRWRNQQMVGDSRQGASSFTAKDSVNEQRCTQLRNARDDVAALQRQQNSPQLSERHSQITGEMNSLKCRQ